MQLDPLIVDPVLPPGVRNAYLVVGLVALYTLYSFVVWAIAWWRVRRGKPLDVRRPPLRSLRLAALTSGLLAIAGWGWSTGWSLEKLDAAPDAADPGYVHPLQAAGGLELLIFGVGVTVAAIAVRALWSLTWPRLAAGRSAPAPEPLLSADALAGDDEPAAATVAAAADPEPEPRREPPVS